MIKRLGGVALVLAVALGTSGCGFKKPTLKFKAVQLRETTLEGTTLDVIYTLNNPNPIGLKLASVGYKLEVENKQVVAGHPPNGLKINSKSSANLVFPAQIKFADIAPVIQTFLTKDQASYRASGDVGIDTPIGVIKFPLSHEGTFPVPKVPSFAFQTPSIQNLSLTGCRIVFPLQMTNRNVFALPVAGFSANVNIAGAQVGTSNAALPPSLAAGESRVVELPLDINFLQAGSAVANAIRTRSANVRLDGALRSGGISVPINLSQNLSFR